ncbi:MAG: hypothetical protein K2Q24_11290 [Chitinophagaceae bacterium]|nr:hypothetical protein [Chitinophagaceae bacterium]
MSLISEKINAQTIVEFGLKPLETFHRNFEINLGLGNKKVVIGTLLAYRFSNQDSGKVGSAGSGLAGGYSWRYNNNLYDSYTAGIYVKRYFGKTRYHFIQVDLFYRNWAFQNKPARYRDERYSFNGIRKENIDVYCIKLLVGKTYFLSKKNTKRRPYIDAYAGAGFRYQVENFETFNGEVNTVYFPYLKERNYNRWFTPQLGIKMGLTTMK